MRTVFSDADVAEIGDGSMSPEDQVWAGLEASIARVPEDVVPGR